MPNPPRLPPVDASEDGRPTASPPHAICVYAEPLVAGRRVVVLGDASLGFGEQLLELGARTVHVYDPKPGRAEARAPVRGLVVRELPAGDFDVRDGAFDVAIVPDLGIAQKPEELVARVRRLLARGGSALIGARAGSDSAEATEYYDLYDRVALQFSHVRMIAEIPFGGVALADLSLEGEAPEVTVDTQLAGDSSPPERFFALASQDDVRLSEYAIVQLPLLHQGSREVVEPRGDAGSAARAALAQAQLRATLLEAQVEELKARAVRQTEGIESAQREVELQARLDEESARLREANVRAGEHYLRAEHLSNDARELGAELAREHDRAAVLEAALAGAEATLLGLKSRIAEGDERLALCKGELAEALTALRLAEAAAGAGAIELARFDAAEARATALTAEILVVSDGHAKELGELEEALRERARLNRELEQEVNRREHIVRELLASLEEARVVTTGEAPDTGADTGAAARDLDLARMDLVTVRRDLEARDTALLVANERAAKLGAVNDELRARLDSLSIDVARREGERQEVAWRVAELEQQISWLEAEQTELTVTVPPPPMGRSRAGGANEAESAVVLQTEIDVLRQAMAQEHEARVRAESGEELSKARAELARQAILLEQLSRELEARDRTRAGEVPGHASTEA
jgi:hypothetical protein